MNTLKALWCEVLLLQVADALYGARSPELQRKDRARVTEEARSYLTRPNRDFDHICGLIGIDPEVARERLKAAISKAPSPGRAFREPLTAS